MARVDDTLAADDYDEFGLLHENAEEWGLPFAGRPPVERQTFELPSGDELSYIRWGTEPAEIVFLHGGGQNAHTWDTVVLALGRPAVAVDLPGHGHSYRRPDRNYLPWSNAAAVATMLEQVAPNAAAIAGMSLGGATTIRLAATRPDLCRSAVIVDVTPQINDPARELTTTERGSVSLIMG
ncbi:MAG: alpha/beta fold hydrolase, partial [Acidimicrobiia bacterium]